MRAAIEQLIKQLRLKAESIEGLRQYPADVRVADNLRDCLDELDALIAALPPESGQMTCSACDTPITDPADIVCSECFDHSLRPLPDPVSLVLSRADCNTLIGYLMGQQTLCDVRLRFIQALDAAARAPEPSGWERAALLKDRTRRAIRDRVQAGERQSDVAADYGVPEGFVAALCAWQMGRDEPPPSASAAQEPEPTT